jgi:hypothetical protein
VNFAGKDTHQTARLSSRALHKHSAGMNKCAKPHKDPKTVMRYDRGRENLRQNAVNFLNFEDE